ncbi:MAG: transposase [bacterium]|nr:transposase [bacterium]
MDDNQLSFPWGNDNSAREETTGRAVVTRRQRGYQIYLSQGVRKASRRKEWSVTSQSVDGAYYTVRYVLGRFVCNCADFADRREPCKHIFAVEYFEGHEDNLPDVPQNGLPRKRDWETYNATKPWVESCAAELLLQLASVIEDPDPTRGHPPAPISELLFASVMRVYVRESGRDFCGDVLQRWVTTQRVSRRYHFNTLSAFMRRPAVGAILRELIRESSSPLANLGQRTIAVDSSGFTTSTSSTWYDVRFHRTRKRDYIKLHIAVDTATHIVTDAVVTESDGADTAQLPGLIRGSMKRVQLCDVVADKAYTGKPNYDVLTKLGLVPLIPPKDGMTGRGNRFMEQMFHAFRAEDPDVLSRYHQRSNVETVMFMIKQQFGDRVAARSKHGQINELLAKVLCHNLQCLVMATAELGIMPRFFRGDAGSAA